jgi:hypothetical protein
MFLYPCSGAAHQCFDNLLTAFLVFPGFKVEFYTPTDDVSLMSIIDKPVKIVPGYKGRPKLLIDGYVYFRNNERNGKTYWLCSKNRSIKCVSRLITKSSEVTVKNYVHNHGREYGEELEPRYQ